MKLALAKRVHVVRSSFSLNLFFIAYGDVYEQS